MRINSAKKNNFLRAKNIILILYIFILLITTIYSYSLVDLNLTLFNHPLWENFRNFIIQLGYFQREKSSLIFLIIIGMMFLINFLITKTKSNPIKIALITAIITLLSYPFLSHDFFNYLFDAKILTFYHKNPYFYKALDFPNDPWLRFMHWTHRTYPYGPVFLLISLVPSFLAFGKFVLNFFFFKLMFVLFYLMAVYCLNKTNKKWALFFTTHPLIIIEGLVSPHNDLIGVSLAIVGIYYFLNKRNMWGRLFLILSAGIKYITLPLVFISKSNKKINYLVSLAITMILIYLVFKSEIQPWYFLTLLVFLPFNAQLINRLNIFFAGLLFSYYPYVRFGGWDQTWKVDLKHQIILFFFLINIVYLLLSKKLKGLSLF